MYWRTQPEEQKSRRRLLRRSAWVVFFGSSGLLHTGQVMADPSVGGRVVWGFDSLISPGMSPESGLCATHKKHLASKTLSLRLPALMKERGWQALQPLLMRFPEPSTHPQKAASNRFPFRWELDTFSSEGWS